MAQSRQSTGSETPRAGGAESGKSQEQERSGKRQQETGSRSQAGGDGAAKASAGGKDVMAQAQDQAGTVIEQARQQATTQLSTQQERAASALGTLAGALHEASRQVREQEDAMMAGYIDTAASQVDRLADTLKQQNLGQIIDSTGRFARQQPAVFLAAAIAVGFAGARFLRSSAPSSGYRAGSSGYGSSRDQFGGYGSEYDTGSLATGAGRDLGYGSMSAGDPSGFATTTNSGAGRADWQARSSFDSGPEGQ